MRLLRGWLLAAMAAVGVAVLCGSVARAEPPEVQKNGLAYAKGHTAGHGKPGSALLTYHGGGVMTSGAAVQAIFWGPKWGNGTTAFAADKLTGLKSFYGGIGNTPYLQTNTEYTDAGGNHVSSAISPYANSLIDGSTTPSRDPGTTAILAEVSKMITNPVSNGYYPVYTDIRRGSSGYCAWHSWGTSHGVSVQFAFFYDLDGDSGCDPGDSGTTHTQGLEALANVSGHELSEALTDPRGQGWFDRQGAENADKCAWTFNGYEPFGGSNWLIQGNFSNNAYNTRTGYDHAGCINGN